MKLLRMMKMLVIGALVILGCSRGERLEGKWLNAGTGETVEFRGDETGTFIVPNRPSLTFTWVALESHRVKVDISIQGVTRTLYGRVDDGTLVMENVGQKAVYRKVK